MGLKNMKSLSSNADTCELEVASEKLCVHLEILIMAS